MNNLGNWQEAERQRLRASYCRNRWPAWCVALAAWCSLAVAYAIALAFVG